MKENENDYSFPDFFINCSYFPVEIPAAGGLKSERLWPSGEKISYHGLLPVYFCPYSRSFLNEAKQKSKPVLLTNSCDAFRRVFDVLTEESFLLEVPYVANQVNSFLKHLHRLINYLDIEMDGNELNDLLKDEIDKFNELRQLLRKLLSYLLIDQTTSFVTILSGIKYYYQGDREAILHLIKETKETKMLVKDRKATQRKPRVLLSSSCLLDGSIIQIIEKIGLQLVGLDSCLGERAFNFQVKLKNDPLFDLADGYLHKPACPRTMEADRRISEVSKLVKSRKADGIIYFIPKFCDQASYDFAQLKRQFSLVNLQVLLLEGEYSSGESGQINTRITAFKETLEQIIDQENYYG